MRSQHRQTLIIGFCSTIAIFAGLFVVVGADAVFESLRTADPWFVAAIFTFGLCWLISWSLMLRTVLTILGIELSIVKAFFVYSGAVFANNVTPFGQAGGEPIAALLISRVTNARYETGLASIATVDVCNIVPSISMALVAVGYYATTATVEDRIEAAIGAAVALVTGLVVALILAWRYRDSIAMRVPNATGRLGARLSGGRLEAKTVETEARERLWSFFGDFRRITTDRRQLGTIIALSLTGWLFQAAALLAAFTAVGYSVSVAVIFFVIPLANLAGAAPLPGGLGGIETAFVLLLTPTTGVPVPAIAAAVLVFRGAVYWLPILIGGGSTVVFGIRTAV